jgi:hypothetical protein
MRIRGESRTEEHQASIPIIHEYKRSFFTTTYL